MHNDRTTTPTFSPAPRRTLLHFLGLLSAARDALRYCYTGSLASETFRDLLLVRRIAVELQISGCEEAADNLMAACGSGREGAIGGLVKWPERGGTVSNC